MKIRRFLLTTIVLLFSTKAQARDITITGDVVRQKNQPALGERVEVVESTVSSAPAHATGITVSPRGDYKAAVANVSPRSTGAYVTCRTATEIAEPRYVKIDAKGAVFPAETLELLPSDPKVITKDDAKRTMKALVETSEILVKGGASNKEAETTRLRDDLNRLFERQEGGPPTPLERSQTLKELNQDVREKFESNTILRNLWKTDATFKPEGLYNFRTPDWRPTIANRLSSEPRKWLREELLVTDKIRAGGDAEPMQLVEKLIEQVQIEPGWPEGKPSQLFAGLKDLKHEKTSAAGRTEFARLFNYAMSSEIDRLIRSGVESHLWSIKDNGVLAREEWEFLLDASEGSVESLQKAFGQIRAQRNTPGEIQEIKPLDDIIQEIGKTTITTTLEKLGIPVQKNPASKPDYHWQSFDIKELNAPDFQRFQIQDVDPKVFDAGKLKSVPGK